VVLVGKCKDKRLLEILERRRRIILKRTASIMEGCEVG
jgi:hypothetical protein